MGKTLGKSFRKSLGSRMRLTNHHDNDTYKVDGAVKNYDNHPTVPDFMFDDEDFDSFMAGTVGVEY